MTLLAKNITNKKDNSAELLKEANATIKSLEKEINDKEKAAENESMTELSDAINALRETIEEAAKTENKDGYEKIATAIKDNISTALEKNAERLIESLKKISDKKEVDYKPVLSEITGIFKEQNESLKQLIAKINFDIKIPETPDISAALFSVAEAIKTNNRLIEALAANNPVKPAENKEWEFSIQRDRGTNNILKIVAKKVHN